MGIHLRRDETYDCLGRDLPETEDMSPNGGSVWVGNRLTAPRLRCVVAR